MREAGIVAMRLPIRPWFRDHCFNGRIILPAVEAMRLLAESVQAVHPAVNVHVMEDAAFSKFLEIPQDQGEIDIQVEVIEMDGGRVQARLLTRRQLKGMSRLTEHCQLFFGGGEENDAMQPPVQEAQPAVRVSAERIYRELVPFGPAYRTLQGQISLGRDCAQGRLQAPDLPVDFAPIGSPFPLDGAMHAACVQGQRLVDFVPFPVGFAVRQITLPTEPGEEYGFQAHLRSRRADELVYDLQIFDQRDGIRESVRGLRMRDVSNGRRRPPAWIRARPDEGQAFPNQAP
jgi:hypothetical protein